jgi:GLPGLI family protein
MIITIKILVMKKTILSFAVIIISVLNMQAQEFKGMVIYESKTNTSDFKNRMQGNRQLTPEMQQLMEERMKKMSEKTFVLNFNREASIYKEEEKLETPGQNQGGGGFRMMSSLLGAGGTFYKNIKEKLYTVDKEFMGKEFLVKDSLPKMDWKITGEARQIGGYNCFKATALKAVSKSDFRNYRMKKEEDKKTENSQISSEPAKKTNFMDQLEMPKEITITAWFTPEIPVSQGPEMYYGLPGLILEINDGKTVVLCSKIVLNSKDKVEIKAPTKGKEVTQKEFDEIVVKKMEEMRQMNQGRGGNGGFRQGMGH